MEADTRFWARQPLLFGQVREDAEVERWLVQRHGAVSRAVVVASAGCTVLSLADLVRERIEAVDINPRQLALTEIKLAALGALERTEFLTMLGGPSALRDLALELSPRARALIAELPATLPKGLQNAGSVDRLIGTLRGLFFTTVHSRKFVEEFLWLDFPGEQRSRFDEEWDTRLWKLATGLAFNRAALRIRFGKAAAARVPASFATLVRERVRDRLVRFSCRGNGCVWQAFLGEYPAGIEAALPCYARKDMFPRVAACARKVHLHEGDLRAWLAGQAGAGFDFLALSNVLELAAPRAAISMLEAASRAAASGALVCLRAILPPENLPERIGRLVRDDILAETCARMDRSLVCNRFTIYRAES
jgi:S-adenosylmethionine-diacylglycerol 3-amino-3-carboxypropyl transferase